MPLPLLLIGVAAAFGGGGVYKGWRAKGHYGESKQLTESARLRYENALQVTATQSKATNEALARLGALKVEIYDRELRAFVAAFQQIKNAELTRLVDPEVLDGEQLPELDVNGIDFSAIDAAKTAIAAGGSGAAAGAATLTAVGALGTASTGTAIGTLSGAAATNATLAWLGGGSLATGGAGVAGGAMVLGGVIAGPLLAVGGLVLDAQAKKALEKAKATDAEARAAEAQLDAMRAVAAAIARRADQLTTMLERLRAQFGPMVAWTEHLVEHEIDYGRYDPQQRAKLAIATSTAITLRNLLDVPLLTRNGTVSRKSATVLKGSRKTVELLESRKNA